MPAHLRVFPSDDRHVARQEPTIHVSLGELLPLMALAQRNNHLWLQDFLDDEICITPDLYDVLQAFRFYRPSA
jgi:hypothetical protein